MLFWLTILGGFAFVYLGLRIGFYMIWQSLFNTLVAVYLSVMIAPRLIGLVPELAESGYYFAPCVLVLALLFFLLLQTITACFLTGISEVALPRAVEMFGTPLLGFVLGYVIVGFVLFLVYLLPISHTDFAQRHVFKTTSQAGLETRPPLPVRTTIQTCRFIGFVSLQCHEGTVERTVHWLIQSARPSPPEPERQPPPESRWRAGPEVAPRR